MVYELTYCSDKPCQKGKVQGSLHIILIHICILNPSFFSFLFFFLNPQVLLSMGVFIPEPDPNKSPGTIEECHDTLDIYKALCSEAYISLASGDPIERAFQMYKRLIR